MTNDQICNSGLKRRKKKQYDDTMKLPKGKINMDSIIEAKNIVDALINDRTFKQSIEETDGSLERVWADWTTGKIIFDFLDGRRKSTKISLVVKKLIEANYLKDFTLN